MLADKNCSTEVIIAALNEEKGIGLTIAELAENMPIKRVMVVDGRSYDRTVEVAKDCGADILFQDGAGKGNAIAKALENVGLNTEYVVFTDADYTYPAEHVPGMIKILEQNPKVGMVCGNRFAQKTEEETQQKPFYMGNKMLSFAHSLLNGVYLDDPLTGLRVVRADLLRGCDLKSKGFDVEVELNHQVERSGLTIVEVPIKYRQRVGEKKLKMRHGASILKRILLQTLS